jgi:hypothetical protein
MQWYVIPYEVGAYYIFNRGYVDYTTVFIGLQNGIFICSQSQKELKFEVMSHNPVDEKLQVSMTDQTGFLKGFYTSKIILEASGELHFMTRDKNTSSYSLQIFLNSQPIRLQCFIEENVGK